MCYKHFLRSRLFSLLLTMRHPQFVNIRETEVPFCYTSCVSYNLLLLFSHCCHDLLFFFFYYFSKCGFEVYPPASRNATPTSVFVMAVRHCYSTIVVVCTSLCFVSLNLVQRITQIIKDYQERVREMPCVPKTFLWRDSLGYPGDANKVFLTLQFSEHAIRVQFLKDVGLIRSRCSVILEVAMVPAMLILVYFFPTRRYRKPLTETEVGNGFRSFLAHNAL
jgi:hypothetical protein